MLGNIAILILITMHYPSLFTLTHTSINSD
jgi:hypothetical protein